MELVGEIILFLTHLLLKNKNLINKNVVGLWTFVFEDGLSKYP